MVVCLPEPQLDRVLHALANQTRRDIVRRTLVEDASVSELAARYDMSFAAVQKHVAVLESAGLVSKATRGRERLVAAVPDQVARARTALQELEALWRHRLTGLDAVLNEPEE